MSHEDYDEFKAHDPDRNLRITMRQHFSDTAVVAHYKGKPIAFGGNQGDCVWFLTSFEVERMTREEKLQFRALIMEYRDTMLAQYPTLWNYVWVGNKSHIRFLKSIGAVFHDNFSVSPKTGENFQLFTIGG